MADIPLNYFKRQVFTLTTSPTVLYIAPSERASIILAAYATNTTPNDITITLGVSGVGYALNFIDPLPYYDYAKDVLISGQDTTSMIPNKFVLNAYDALIGSCNASGVILNVALLETSNTIVV